MMSVPLFISPLPLRRYSHSRTATSASSHNIITPVATTSDKHQDNNLRFIKDRLDDLRSLVSTPSLPSLLSTKDLQRLVAISTFRALAPTPVDHLCPIPTEPSFNPTLALNLAVYAFRAYQDPPSSAYRETLTTPVGDRYTLQADFVYPSTQRIAASATGVFLLKISDPEGYITAHINGASVRDVDTIGHVALLRIVHPGQTPEDVLKLLLYPPSDRKAAVPSHVAHVSLKAIVDNALETQCQTSHSPITLTFDPIDSANSRIDYFEETFLPNGLRLPFMMNGTQNGANQKEDHDLKVTVEASFLPFTVRSHSDAQSGPDGSAREDEEPEDLEEPWDSRETSEALDEAIHDAAEEEEEAEKSLTLPERRRRDAMAFILRMQLPERTMPASTDWKRLAVAATNVINRLPELPEYVRLVDANASPCLFVESQATDTEVWFFRDTRHKSLVVSFRGTEQVSWRDFFTDAQMFLQRWAPGEDIDLTVTTRNTVRLAEFVPSVLGKAGTEEKMADDDAAVHYGFLRAYMSVRDAVDRGISLLSEGESEYKVLFTGHSLGGALATVAAGDYAARRGGSVCCISYGAPKVGNVNFARRFNELVPNAFRVVNDSDLVSRMPRSLSGGGAVDRYRHSGRTVLVNDFGDYWIEGENDETLAERKSSIANPFRERKDLTELIQHERELWEQLLSGISVKHHMEDSYFTAIQKVVRRVAESLNRGDDKTV